MNPLGPVFILITFVSLPFGRVHAEVMSECALSVRSRPYLSVQHDESVGHGTVAKSAEVRPGGSRFVFLLTGSGDFFGSYVRLRGDGTNPLELDFDFDGHQTGNGSSYLNLTLWAARSKEIFTTVSAVMPWHRFSKDKVPYARLATLLVSPYGEGNLEVSVNCGPDGWTDSGTQ